MCSDCAIALVVERRRQFFTQLTLRRHVHSNTKREPCNPSLPLERCALRAWPGSFVRRRDSARVKRGAQCRTRRASQTIYFQCARHTAARVRFSKAHNRLHDGTIRCIHRADTMSPSAAEGRLSYDKTDA